MWCSPISRSTNSDKTKTGTVADNEIRGSRIRRAASMTGAAAGVAAREATARAIRLGGSGSDTRRAAASRQQLKSAETLVKVLGGMRGAR